MNRTCVGCRQRSDRANLLRVVEKSYSLIFDEQKSMPGRGAWIHPSSKCLELAIERKAFSRALKLSKQFDATGLVITKEQAETMLAKNE
ncbi:MAG: YlxR family protein [Rhodoluna sp.]